MKIYRPSSADHCQKHDPAAPALTAGTDAGQQIWTVCSRSSSKGPEEESAEVQLLSAGGAACRLTTTDADQHSEEVTACNLDDRECSRIYPGPLAAAGDVQQLLSATRYLLSTRPAVRQQQQWEAPHQDAPSQLPFKGANPLSHALLTLLQCCNDTQHSQMQLVAAGGLQMCVDVINAASADDKDTRDEAAVAYSCLLLAQAAGNDAVAGSMALNGIRALAAAIKYFLYSGSELSYRAVLLAAVWGIARLAQRMWGLGIDSVREEAGELLQNAVLPVLTSSTAALSTLAAHVHGASPSTSWQHEQELCAQSLACCAVLAPLVWPNGACAISSSDAALAEQLRTAVSHLAPASHSGAGSKDSHTAARGLAQVAPQLVPHWLQMPGTDCQHLQQQLVDLQLNAAQVLQVLLSLLQQTRADNSEGKPAAATAAAVPELMAGTTAGATAVVAVVSASRGGKDSTNKISGVMGTSADDGSGNVGMGVQNTAAGVCMHNKDPMSVPIMVSDSEKQRQELHSARQGRHELSPDIHCSINGSDRQQLQQSQNAHQGSGKMTCGDRQSIANSGTYCKSCTDGSGSGSSGSSCGGGTDGGGGSARGFTGGDAGRNGGTAAGSGGSSSSSSGGGGGDDDGRRGERRQMPVCRTPEVMDPDTANPDGGSAPDAEGGTALPAAAAAGGVAGTAPAAGCSATDPIVLPGLAAPGASLGSLGLLGVPGSVVPGHVRDSGAVERALSASQPDKPAAGVHQHGSFSFPARLPPLNLSAINTSGAGAASISSLTNALLSPLATAGWSGLTTAGEGLPQQGPAGFTPAGVQHVGSQDPSISGFTGLGELTAAASTTGRRASDAGPGGTAAAAGSWNLTHWQLQQQQNLLQQQQQPSLGGVGLDTTSWSAVPSSILALEQQLQQSQSGQQRQQQQYLCLSPAGSGSVHSMSSLMSGQQQLATPLLSPTPSFGMPPLPPTQQQQQQQHMHRMPLLPSACSAPSSGRPPSSRPQAFCSELHLLNPSLMRLIGSNDPGIGWNNGPCSVSSSDNLLTCLSNDEFSRLGGGMLSGSASETDTNALAQAAAALSLGTALTAGQAATAPEDQQPCKQQQEAAEATASSSGVDAQRAAFIVPAGEASITAAVIQPATMGSNTAAGPEATAANKPAATVAGADRASAGPVYGLASAGSSSSTMSRSGSSGSAAAMSIAHSLSGESLADLEELKARSASFAAALAEAEEIAAGVEASMEAARQQQQTETPPRVQGYDPVSGSAASTDTVKDTHTLPPAAGSSTSPNAAVVYDPAELTKGQPSRHLWLGNLHQRLPRSVLRGVFEKFGPVDDVVTFPGRMYAFVNFKEAIDAARAAEAVQEQEIPVITGDRRLVVKFRPSRRALGKVAEAMVPGLVDPAGASASATSSNAGSSANLATAAGGPPGATASRSSSEVSPAWPGALVTAAVFPADVASSQAAADSTEGNPVAHEIGSSSASEVQVADTAGVLSSSDPPAAQLGQQLLPPASYPPAAGSCGGPDTVAQRDQTQPSQQQSCRLSDAAAAAAAAVAAAAAAVASSSTDSNAATAAHVAAAAAALAAVDAGMPHGPAAGGADAATGDDADIPEGKPSRHLWLGNIPLKPARAAMESLFSSFGPLESVRVFPGKTFAFVNFVHAAHAIAAKSTLDGSPSPHITGPKQLVIRFQKDTAGLPSAQASNKALEAAAARARKSIGRSSLTGGGVLVGSSGGVLGGDEDLVAQPAVNLSNKLNPNNIHYDRELAARYKRMSKSEKEALWAQDRAMQHLEHTPAAASLLSAAAAVAAAGQTPTSSLFEPMLQQQDPAAAGGLYSQLISANSQLAAVLHQAQAGATVGHFQFPAGVGGGVAAGSAWGQAAAYQQAAAAAQQAQALRHAAALGSRGGLLGGLGLLHGAATLVGDWQQYLEAGAAMSNPLLDQIASAQLQQQMATYLSTQQDPTAAVTALQLHAGHDPARRAALGMDSTALQAQLAGVGPDPAAIQTVSGSILSNPVGAAAAAGGVHGLAFTPNPGLSAGGQRAAAAGFGGLLSQGVTGATLQLPSRRLSYPGSQHSPPGVAHQQLTPLGRLSGTWGQSAHASELRGWSGSAEQLLGEECKDQRGFRSSSSTGGGLLGSTGLATAAVADSDGGLGPIGPVSTSIGTGNNGAAARVRVFDDLAAPQQQEQMSDWGYPGPLDTSTPHSAISSPGQLPQHCLCPLTQQLMADPVVAADGYTYERSAISEWLRLRDVSPVTGLRLSSATLQPNHNLRQAIAAEVTQLQGAAGGH